LNGEPYKYYRLPRETYVQGEYSKIFCTSGVNWEKGHICSAHWSTGERKNASDLPDIAVPVAQFNKLQLKYITAKYLLAKYKSPSVKIKCQYKNAKRKYELATQIMNSQKPSTRTPVDRANITPISTRKFTPSKRQFRKKLDLSDKKVEDLGKKLEEANNTIDSLENKLKLANIEIKKLKQANIIINSKLNTTKHELAAVNNKNFSYANLVKQPSMFQYLCGLNFEQFDIILKCALPYVHLIPYPDCAGSVNRRKTDSATELFLLKLVMG